MQVTELILIVVTRMQDPAGMDRDLTFANPCPILWVLTNAS